MRGLIILSVFAMIVFGVILLVVWSSEYLDDGEDDDDGW